MLNRTGGGGGEVVRLLARSQSCPCKVPGSYTENDSGSRRQVAAAAADLSSASSSAVFPYYSQRLDCSDLPSQPRSRRGLWGGEGVE